MQPSLALNYSIVTQGAYAGPASNSGGGPFIGEVRLTARNSVPNSEDPTNGQLRPINQNPPLFTIIGTTYGGNGVTTFGMPDLRGRAAMGAGAAPGLTSRGLGETDGTEAVTMTEAQMPQHSHTLPPTPLMTGPAGGSQPLPNMQPSLALNYLIATDGIFPARQASNNQETFLGEIVLFAGNYAPTDFHIADGSLLPVASNEALFEVLGTTYGGDGVTVFALPDLRGRAALQPGTGPGLTERMLAETLGAETVTLTTAQLAPHTHDAVPEPSAGVLALLGAASVAMRRRRRAA
jgi:microcystin-dependent protein